MGEEIAMYIWKISNLDLDETLNGLTFDDVWKEILDMLGGE